MESVTTRVAEPADIPAIRTVVAHALADDPLIRWLLPPETPNRLSRVAMFFSAEVERLVILGHTDVAVADDQIVGAALWVPPDTGQLGALPVASELVTIVAAPERLVVFVEQSRTGRAAAPEHAGPYLATLGVLDQHRGQGTGRRLLDAGHGFFGETATWLESTNPGNLSLYQRCGYRTIHQAPFADDTTTISCLVREP